MKILLLSCNPVVAPYPVYPLGMSVIAAALTQAGHAVRQFDMLAHAFDLGKLAEAIAAEAPGMIGISFRNLDNVNACNEALYIDQLTRLVATVRSVTTAPVVLGGPGFSVMPERVLEATGADYGVVGEGERLAVALADALARGERPAQRLFRADATLDAGGMVSAAYDDDILAFYQQSGGILPLQTKRGCPCQCAYCTYPLLEGRRIRPRDCDAVIDDILKLQAKGARQLFFTDSIFNDPAGSYRQLIDALRRRKVSIPWTGFFRPEVIEPEVIGMMKETGLNAVELGSDATSDTTLRGMAKSFVFKDVEAAHACFLEAGLTVSHYFMMGGPGETQETVEAGIANILRLKGAASFVFLGIRILPGTPLAARALQEGVITPDTDLLHPVYYFSPLIDRQWLHERLTVAFKPHRHVVYPPDAFDSGLAFLHRLGYAGMSIDLLLKKRERPAAAPAN
jgi:lipid biosynthesis B12-binding/radical SAM protein